MAIRQIFGPDLDSYKNPSKKIFASKKRQLKEKTQDANFSLPIKNANPLLKYGFGFQN